MRDDWKVSIARAVCVAVLLMQPLPGADGALRERLRSALANGELNTARAAVDRLTVRGTSEAIDALVEVGLRSDTFDAFAIERYICERLSDVRDEVLLQRICFHANKHKDYRIRVMLTRVLAAREEAAAQISVLANLYDRSDSVVRATLAVAAKEGGFHLIDHLIRALEYHEGIVLGHEEQVLDIRRALRGLTGSDLEPAADWKNFWESRRQNFVRLRQVETGTGRTRSIRPYFFGTRVDSRKVLFLLDVSASMAIKDALPSDLRGRTAVVNGRSRIAKEPPENRRRLTRARTELIRVLSELPEDTWFTVVGFNHGLDYFAWSLVRATEDHRTRAQEFVRKFTAFGETWTHRALQAALETPDVGAIFLLSDGAPRLGNQLMSTEPVLKSVQEWNRHRFVRIHTIGFAQASPRMREFLRQLAGQSGGVYQELK